MESFGREWCEKVAVCTGAKASGRGAARDSHRALPESREHSGWGTFKNTPAMNQRRQLCAIEVRLPETFGG